MMQEELRNDDGDNDFEWYCSWHDLEYRIQLSLEKTKEEIIDKFYIKLDELNVNLRSLIETLELKKLDEEFVCDSSVYFDDIDAINKEKIAIRRVLNNRNPI